MADKQGFRAQWRWLSWVLMGIIAVAALIVGVADDNEEPSDGERVSQLASTIRCPQCRGQSVAESNVAIAREIRADIRTRIGAGEADDQIRQVYIDRFGRSVVLTPDASGFTGLVWIVPVVAAALASLAVYFAFWRWRSTETAVAASDEDRALVAELRKNSADKGPGKADPGTADLLDEEADR